MARVVAEVSTIHAQMQPAAELSLCQRLNGTTRSGVRRALEEDRVLVRAHGLRGTIHLLPASEYTLWRAGLRFLRRPTDPRRQRWLRTPAEDGERIVATIGAVLTEPMTLAELGDAVVAELGEWAAEPVGKAFTGPVPRWQWFLHAPPICFGPPRGRAVTYVSAERWLGPQPPVDPATAAAELVRRFLHAYGPSTPAEVARWFAVTETKAAALVATSEVEVEGERRLVLAGDELFPEPSPSVRLLGHFDVYAVGAHPRERFAPGAASRIITGGSTGNVPSLLIDGVAAGVWERRLRGRMLEITVDPAVRLTRPRRQQLEAAAQRVAEILEVAEYNVRISEVAARPHL